MGTINETFFSDLASGATWSAGVAFKRSNALPLDRYSVFNSFSAAKTYATTNAVAYPGQMIAVVNEGNMETYVLHEVATDRTDKDGNIIYELDLKEIGARINLDNTSLSFNSETNLLEISGFKNASAATLPQKKVVFKKDAQGKDTTEVDYVTIEWVSIDAIVQGDGDTKYSLTSIKNGKNEIVGVELIEIGTGTKYPITLDVYSKSEVYNKSEIDALDKALQDQITLNKDAIGTEGKDGAVSTGLHLRIDNVASKVTTAEGNITKLQSSMGQVTSGVGNLKTRMTTAEGSITTLQGDMTTAKGDISTLKTTTANNTAAIGTAKEVIDGKVTKAPTGVYIAIDNEETRAKAAETSLSGRITDLSNDITTNYATITYVNDQIAGITHFKTEIVESTAAVTKEGILYLIKDTNAKGDDKYNEYLFINNEAVLIGDTTTDLSNYVTNSALSTTLASYYTKTEINDTLKNYSTPAQVESKIATELSTFKTNIVDASLANYTTTNDLDTRFNDYTTTNDLNTRFNDYTTTANLEANYAKKTDLDNYSTTVDMNDAISKAVSGERTYADSTFAKKEYIGTIPSTSGADTVIAYINKKAKETLDAANGGSSESAASVAADLEAYIADNDPKVSKNTSDISKINTKLSEIEEKAQVNVIESITINGVDATINNKAASVTLDVYTKEEANAEIKKVDDKVATNTTLINTAQQTANAANTLAGTAKNIADANTASINNINDKIGAVGTANTILNDISLLKTAAADHEAMRESINGNTRLISEVSSDLSTLTGTVNSHTTTLTGDKTDGTGGLVGDVAGLKKTTADHEGRIDALEATDTNANERLRLIEDKVGAPAKGKEGEDGYVPAKIGSLVTEIAGLDGRLDTAEGDISDINKDLGDESINHTLSGTSIVDLVQDPKTVHQHLDNLYRKDNNTNNFLNVVSNRLGSAESTINSFESVIGTWIGDHVDSNNKTDATKSIRNIAAEETAKIVAGADTNFDTLKEIADWISTDITGVTSLHTQVQTNSTNIGSIQAQIGNVTIQESGTPGTEGYIQGKEKSGILGSIETLTGKVDKLDGDVNTTGSILNLIKTNNTNYVDANFVKKTAVATDSILGLVKSSSAENKILVATDGTMEVNSLNVNKLTQTAGDTLILNGGSAEVKQ